MFIDAVSTGNTYGNGHDCPVEFSFTVTDFDNCDENVVQIKNFKINPDEKIMPGVRVYAHLPETTSEGNEISKALIGIRHLIKKANEDGLYLVAFDMDGLLKNLRSNMERVLSSNDNAIIDLEEFIDFPPERMISVKSLSKLIYSPEEVGNSSGHEPFYLHACGEQAFHDARKTFDNGSPRSVYNVRMTVGIFKKLCEKKGFSNCSEVINYLVGELGKRFDFGKYAGELVEDVFKKDFGYCLWCFKNKELMDGHTALAQELFRLMKQNKKI